MYWFDDLVIKEHAYHHRYEDLLFGDLLNSHLEAYLAMTASARTLYEQLSSEEKEMLLTDYRNQLQKQKQLDIDAWTEKYGELYYEMFLYLGTHFFPHLNVTVIENPQIPEALVVNDRKSKLKVISISGRPINFPFDWDTPNDWVHFKLWTGNSFHFSNYESVFTNVMNPIPKSTESDMIFLQPLLDGCVSHWNTLKQKYQIEPVGLYFLKS